MHAPPCMHVLHSAFTACRLSVRGLCEPGTGVHARCLCAAAAVAAHRPQAAMVLLCCTTREPLQGKSSFTCTSTSSRASTETN